MVVAVVNMMMGAFVAATAQLVALLVEVITAMHWRGRRADGWADGWVGTGRWTRMTSNGKGTMPCDVDVVVAPGRDFCCVQVCIHDSQIGRGNRSGRRLSHVGNGGRTVAVAAVIDAILATLAATSPQVLAARAEDMTVVPWQADKCTNRLITRAKRRSYRSDVLKAPGQGAAGRRIKEWSAIVPLKILLAQKYLLFHQHVFIFAGLSLLNSFLRNKYQIGTTTQSRYP